GIVDRTLDRAREQVQADAQVRVLLVVARLPDEQRAAVERAHPERDGRGAAVEEVRADPAVLEADPRHRPPLGRVREAPAERTLVRRPCDALDVGEEALEIPRLPQDLDPQLVAERGLE